MISRRSCATACGDGTAPSRKGTEQNYNRRIVSGKVVRGQIVDEGELPEGADVTRIADDHESGFEVGPELKAVLLQAIGECERGETISGDELLRELDGDDETLPS